MTSETPNPEVAFSWFMPAAPLAVALLILAAPPAAAQDQDQEDDEDEAPTFAETVVVTASRIEQEIVNAPATVTVIGPEQIAAQPVASIGELVRQVPGVNVVQTSNREFNVTSRGATSTLATSQIVLVDGRSVYQDVFGFVAWDLIPVTMGDLERVEVVRGPASAVWGANAMSGVVNLITKRPRDMLGTTLDINFGTFDRNVTGRDMDPGTTYSVMGTHAAAPSDTFAYKVSLGYSEASAFARPAGNIPNIVNVTQPYPELAGLDTRTPKFDFRGDWDSPDGQSRFKLTGGYAGTQGMLHSALGPFEISPGAGMGYGRLQYERGSFELGAFVNSTSVPYRTLLVRSPTGPITGDVVSNTFDVSFSNTEVIGTRNIVSYGGNVRLITMDFDLAPAGDGRNEVGFYLQDEIFLHDRFRWILGGRIDRVSLLDDIRFSPRTTFIFKPADEHSIRLSYNQAFRAPSLVNSFLDASIGNVVQFPLDRLLGPAAALLPPALTPAPVNYFLPSRVAGAEVPDVPRDGSLRAENLTAYEVAYAGGLGDRIGLTAAFYVNDITDSIDFSDYLFYSTANAPPNWNASFGPPLAAFAQSLAPVLPPVAAQLGFLAQHPAALIDLLAASGTRFPSDFTYLNRGFIRNKGIELGVNAAIARGVNTYVNYSWQAAPEVRDWDPNEYNIPSAHRFNAGIDASTDTVTASLSVNRTSEAFWTDVLTAQFHGWTDPFTMVNASFGFNFADGRYNPRIQVLNLLNNEIQQHIFGDVMKRQIVGQLRVGF